MTKRHNRKGRRNGEGQFFALPYAMARHEQWRGLSGNAVKVYIELRCRYTVRGDGETNNNGTLCLSLGDAADLLGMSKQSAMRAFAELEAAGFIRKTKQGQWYGRMATEWRVTDKPCGRELATRDWQKMPSQKQNAVPGRNITNRDGSAGKPLA